MVWSILRGVACVPEASFKKKVGIYVLGFKKTATIIGSIPKL